MSGLEIEPPRLGEGGGHFHEVAALMLQNHMTKYSARQQQQQKKRVQWLLNKNYSLTCTPGPIAAQFNQHDNCTTVTTEIAACVSKITIELTTLLACGLMNGT